MTKDEIEDDFLNRLFLACDEFGIDSSEWDGDEDQARIIARGIRTAIDRAIENALRDPTDEAVEAGLRAAWTYAEETNGVSYDSREQVRRVYCVVRDHLKTPNTGDEPRCEATSA